MECPFALEPHQVSLQGMDAIRVFPVVQWLIHKSIEYREANGAAIKAHAVKRFNNAHPTVVS